MYGYNYSPCCLAKSLASSGNAWCDNNQGDDLKGWQLQINNQLGLGAPYKPSTWSPRVVRVRWGDIQLMNGRPYVWWLWRDDSSLVTDFVTYYDWEIWQMDIISGSITQIGTIEFASTGHYDSSGDVRLGSGAWVNNAAYEWEEHVAMFRVDVAAERIWGVCMGDHDGSVGPVFDHRGMFSCDLDGSNFTAGPYEVGHYSDPYDAQRVFLEPSRRERDACWILREFNDSLGASEDAGSRNNAAGVWHTNKATMGPGTRFPETGLGSHGHEYQPAGFAVSQPGQLDPIYAVWGSNIYWLFDDSGYNRRQWLQTAPGFYDDVTTGIPSGALASRNRTILCDEDCAELAKAPTAFGTQPFSLGVGQDTLSGHIYVFPAISTIGGVSYEGITWRHGMPTSSPYTRLTGIPHVYVPGEEFVQVVNMAGLDGAQATSSDDGTHPHWGVTICPPNL